jgi:hypothetical protein
VNAEHRAAQWHDELTGEQAVIEAQLIELHQRMFALETELSVMVNLTKA